MIIDAHVRQSGAIKLTELIHVVQVCFAHGGRIGASADAAHGGELPRDRPGGAGEEPLAATRGEFVPEGDLNPIPVTLATTTIGRTDPVTNIVPDIDLSPFDKTRSVSRRHAKLQNLDGQFLLYEEVGVANGTFVNGEKIAPGEPITLVNGSKVAFGKVAFVFVTKS